MRMGIQCYDSLVIGGGNSGRKNIKNNILPLAKGMERCILSVVARENKTVQPTTQEALTMTALNYHFHHNFNSNGLDTHYTKISVELVEKNAMFCVIINKANGNETHQKFSGVNKRRFVGNNEDGYYNGFGALKADWDKLSKDDRNLFVKACNGLPTSFLKYVKENPEAFITTERDEIYKSLYNLRDDFYELLAGAEATTAEPVTTSTVTSGATTTITSGETTTVTVTSGAFKTAEPMTVVEPVSTTVPVPVSTTVPVPVANAWETIRLCEFSANKLSDIIGIINENGIDGEIDYDGSVYRTVKNGNSFSLQRKTATEPTEPTCAITEPTPKPQPKQKQRKKVSMAYLTDNANLTEFVNGCFYKFVEGKTIDGEQYAIVLNDKGEERKLLSKRVNIIDVFDAPPREEKETEKAMA